MRAFKLILTVLFAAVAVTAGFVVAAIAALVGVVIFLTTRLLGRSRLKVSSSNVQRRHPTPNKGDAIDVLATEVESRVSQLPEAAAQEDRIRV
jgi:uncharacterized protein (DUF58 family)